MLTVLFPLTLAYIIVVQRAMDVRVVVRQGLQYGLATTGIRALQFVAIAIVIATAFALGSNSNRTGKMVVIGDCGNHWVQHSATRRPSARVD